MPGLIDAIYAERSDSVAKGAVIAELESSVERATLVLSQARAKMTASIELREESAAFGYRTRERNQALVKNSAISEQDIDKLETEKHIGQLQVRKEQENRAMAELEYQRAQAALQKLKIRAPVDGVVMERFKTVGEYVENQPVFRVAKLDPLHVEVVVPVEYLGRILSGMRAQVTPVVAGYEGYLATVTKIDRVADAASGTFGVRLLLPNPDYAIPSGLRCRLAFLPADQSLPLVADPKYEPSAITATSRKPAATELNLSGTGVPAMTAGKAMELGVAAVKEMAASLIDFEPPFVAQGPPSQASATSALREFTAPHRVKLAHSSGESTATQLEPSECYTVGPLSDKRLASQLSTMLTAATNESTVYTEHGAAAAEIRILAARQPDGSATLDLLEELEAAGVDDFFVLNHGEHKGRISLGLYRVEEYALERQASLVSKGVKTEVVRRRGTAYWLNLSLKSSPQTGSDLRNMATSMVPNASVQRTSCAPMQAQPAERSRATPPLVPLVCTQCTFPFDTIGCNAYQFVTQTHFSSSNALEGNPL